MNGREPSIATLPREALHDDREPRLVPPSQQGSSLRRSSARGGSTHGPAQQLGFARRAHRWERRLGWILWGALAGLVVVLSS